MSVAFAETTVDRPAADARVGQPAVAPSRPRPRRAGPGVGPAARPRRVRFSSPAVAGPGARACEVAPPVPQQPSRSWRLTDRGMAVVLVVAAALVAASIVVVALTALQVTSESYHPGRTASAPVLVQP